MISLCLMGIFLLGAGVFFLIPHEGLIPTTGEGPLAIFFLVLSILFLLPSIIALAMIRPGDRSRSSRFVRIDHEGFLFLYLFPTVVQWSEISSLVPYTRAYLGRPYAELAIVPKDPEAILARIIDERSRGFFSHFLARINVYFYRRSKTLSPLKVPQVILPVSVDELIAMIQERFANELREHRVAILEWQEGNV